MAAVAQRHYYRVYENSVGCFNIRKKIILFEGYASKYNIRYSTNNKQIFVE